MLKAIAKVIYATIPEPETNSHMFAKLESGA